MRSGTGGGPRVSNETVQIALAADVLVLLDRQSKEVITRLDLGLELVQFSLDTCSTGTAGPVVDV